MALNVLLIDDSPVMRKMVSRALRQSGLDIGDTSEASNGKEGLTALDANPVDLVICDWNMPEMDGLEFVKTLRANKCNTPVVMVTTEGTEDRISAALSAGANGFISKPFTPDDLGSRISIVLEG